MQLLLLLFVVCCSNYSRCSNDLCYCCSIKALYCNETIRSVTMTCIYCTAVLHDDQKNYFSGCCVCCCCCCATHNFYQHLYLNRSKHASVIYCTQNVTLIAYYYRVTTTEKQRGRNVSLSPFHPLTGTDFNDHRGISIYIFWMGFIHITAVLLSVGMWIEGRACHYVQ